MNEWSRYLSDQWFMFVWHNFSFLMVMIPSIAAAILKIVATRHPNVPSDGIMDLIRVIFTKPGTVTETHTEIKTETRTDSTTGDKKGG